MASKRDLGWGWWAVGLGLPAVVGAVAFLATEHPWETFTPGQDRVGNAVAIMLHVLVGGLIGLMLLTPVWLALWGIVVLLASVVKRLAGRNRLGNKRL